MNVGSNSALYTTSALATGDVVTATLTSNSACATVATVTASGPPIAVVAVALPGVSVAGPAAVSLCAGSTYTFTALPVNGGVVPGYQWYRNGVGIMGATSAIYNGGGFGNGDSVWVVLGSSAACRFVDSVRSVGVKLTVSPNIVPVVTVSASPGLLVPAGVAVTFTASMSAGGAAAQFQWFRNGAAVAGATGATYTTTTLVGGDLVSVRASNLGPCAVPDSVLSSAVRVSDPAGIGSVGGGGNSGGPELVLYPNPGSGLFRVATDWGGVLAGEQVLVEVVNDLGQVVWGRKVALYAGRWELEVDLGAGIADGLYLLRMQRQGNGRRVAKTFVVQR